MNNSQSNAEAYREVIHEDKIKIGSATKAPDYSFRLPGGKRLFFVEAIIKYTDEKINQLVFEMYGLSEEEIGIVKIV